MKNPYIYGTEEANMWTERQKLRKEGQKNQRKLFKDLKKYIVSNYDIQEIRLINNNKIFECWLYSKDSSCNSLSYTNYIRVDIEEFNKWVDSNKVIPKKH